MGEDSFVRIENANLVKINLRSLAKNFAKYTQLMLEIKKLSDAKKQKRKEIAEKVKEIEKKLNTLIPMLPKVSEKLKKEIKPKERAVEISGELESFEDLRAEFERLKRQLEEIKQGL